MHDQRGWDALIAIGYSIQQPRPRHPGAATEEDRAALKKTPDRGGRGTAQASGRDGRGLGDGRTLPIRLLPTPPTCRVLPGSGVKLCVGRCGDVARDAEQGTEGLNG